MPKRRQTPLQQEYEYQLHKRSGWAADQLPSAASAGDREALGQCAGVAAVIIETASIKPEFHDLRDWLIDALSRIYAGEEPNLAFGWTQPTKRQRRRAFRTIQREWIIGQHIKALLAANPGLSPEEAAERVGGRWGVSGSTALDYWKAFDAEG